MSRSNKRACLVGIAVMVMAISSVADEIPWTYRIENHPADVIATSTGSLGKPLDAVSVVGVSTTTWSLDSVIEDFRSSALSCLNTFRWGMGIFIR